MNYELIMATNNAHKLEEIRQILGSDFSVKGLNDIGCMEDIPSTVGNIRTFAGQQTVEIVVLHPFVGVVG